MTILLVGPSDFDTPIYSLRVLLQAHHQVSVFDPFQNLGLPRFLGGQLSLPVTAWTSILRATLREPFRIANRKLIDKVRVLQPDLIIVISIQVIEPETISEITQTSNSIVVGWFMDAISNFERCYFMLADYHALFFVDPYITNLLSLKTGKPVHYLPICCDPAIHAPVPLSSEDQEEYSCDLTIAGNLYPYRVAMLDQFQDYDLKIWGRRHRWLHHPLNEKHTNRPVFGLEKSKAMRAAKIVLNTVHYANIQGINKRTFEVAGCGAFQLSDAPGLPDAFRPDVEIATFSSKQDLKDKVDYYLGHPGERAEMAERAQKRAHGEHTYAHRWHRMVEILAHEGIAVPFPDRDVNAVVA